MPPAWAASPPRIFSVVTGFFPEASPKARSAVDPRPLLVCGTALAGSGEALCRVAYGTTRNLDKAHGDDLVVLDPSLLGGLGLRRPTRFVLHSGRQMVILPWTDEFFRPWSGRPTPVLGRLPDGLQRQVAATLGRLPDLPRF